MVIERLSKIAADLGVAEADVAAFCAAAGIRIFKEADGTDVISSVEDRAIIEVAFRNPKYRPKLEVSVGYSDYLHGNHPEIAQYLCYHDVVDILCWMLKLRYASQEDVRKRRYRLDTLFGSFLQEQAYDLARVKRLINKNASPEKFAFHLKKGWYNELVRSSPLHPDMLNIGTKTLGQEFSEGRYLSWNITQSYYSVYEYVNALVFSNNSIVRTENHKASTNLFESGLQLRLSNHLITYPFNLTSPLAQRRTLKSFRQGDKPYWKYQYSRCPRNISKSINDLEGDYMKAILPEKSLVNFLYDFRVWANYQGIESLLEVQNGHLVSYLYRNLGTICFFYGCFAEIMALALLGEETVVGLLEEMSKKFVLRQENFLSNQYLVPQFVRFRFYHRYGLIKTLPTFILPPDPIIF
jgi:hypothetical protein